MSDNKDQPERRRRRGIASAEPVASVRRTAAAAQGAGALDLAGIAAHAMALVADVGISCRLPTDAAEACSKAGLVVTESGIRIPADRLGELANLAPRRFVHAAADESKSIEVSTAMSAFGAALSARHIWRGQTRAPLTIADAMQLAAVAEQMPGLDYCAGSLGLMAAGAIKQQRLAAFAAGGSRPKIAPSGLPVRTRDLIDAVTIESSTADPSCQLMVIATVEEALTFSDAFVEAITDTAAARQGIVIAPALLIGANTPATVEGALVRFAAEAMAGVALAQALCPGQPVAVGATVSDVSMRNGLPLVGTSNALAVLGGAIALARRMNLAFYACGPATNAKGLNALATSETARWLTAAHYLGANAVIGAIGAVDLDDGISAEKLVIDAEAVATLGIAATSVHVDPLADLKTSGPGGIFLGTPAARALARVTARQRLADSWLYESWIAAGRPMLDQAISGIIASAGTASAPPADDATDVPLLDRSPTGLADLASSLYSRSIRDAFGFGG